MEGLKDEVFIVTGGGSDIGAATVQRLLVEGARVTAAGTNAEKLARAREQASEAADRLLTVQFDLRDEDSITSPAAGAAVRGGGTGRRPVRRHEPHQPVVHARSEGSRVA
ncbi:SDR family NAD(P)-dependent oxidoreductase [Streptomyces sp. NPDC058206]|uniref:SDR family NAD(P)-dependent oxidoreductase n=1 Tax=Streptomyces sp. NPDC058206 TaxID=3346382 RepID=UPI0036EA1311